MWVCRDKPTPVESASLERYVDAVIATIGNRLDVILVGHSMAGMVISAVAEAIPAQLQKLVYVSAYLPRDYIETLQDQAVSHSLQTLMLIRTPVQKRFQMNTSHSPFFAVPDEFVGYLT